MAYDINQRFYELLIHWLIIVKFAINKYRLQISKKKLKIDEVRHDNWLIVFHVHAGWTFHACEMSNLPLI